MGVIARKERCRKAQHSVINTRRNDDCVSIASQLNELHKLIFFRQFCRHLSSNLLAKILTYGYLRLFCVSYT